MNRYKETLRRLGGVRTSGLDDKWSDVLSMKWIMYGGVDVIWRLDARSFLTDVHKTGTTKDMVFREHIPLAEVENVVRQWEVVTLKGTPLMWVLSWVPLVRVGMVVKPGKRYVYTKTGRLQHKRVTDWCKEMREFCDEVYRLESEKKANPTYLQPAHNPNVTTSASGANGSEVSTKRRAPDMIPKAVFAQTLAGVTRHRRLLDIIRVFTLAVMVSIIVSLIVANNWENILVTDAIATLALNKLMGRPANKDTIRSRLLWYLTPASEVEAGKPKVAEGVEGYPERIVRVDGGKVFVKVFELRNKQNARVLVVPLPRWGAYQFYFEVAEVLKQASVVGLEAYNAKTLPSEIREISFFPPAHPTITMFNVFRHFLPIYHTSPPYPKICGTHHNQQPAPICEILLHFSTAQQASLGKEAASTFATKATQYPIMAAPFIPPACTHLAEHLIKRGYTQCPIESQREFLVFDADEGVETMLRAHPMIRRFMD